MAKSQRLSRNFHQSFKPERQYINALLRFAASGKLGNYQEIASETGIPMGKSSGKVPAIIDYCKGMGLITLAPLKETGIKKPILTPFGRVILLEDPFLKLGISQWLAHFHLCSPLRGAEFWYQTFFPGKQALGFNFDRSQLTTYLQSTQNVEAAGLIGPLVGMYEDEAAFKTCGALTESNSTIMRKPAPVNDELALGYGAWILQLMQSHFPKNRQVAIVELDSCAGWRTIPGWDIDSLQLVLGLAERKGILTVDRHMEPWILQPRLSAEDAWKLIFDDMI